MTRNLFISTSKNNTMNGQLQLHVINASLWILLNEIMWLSNRIEYNTTNFKVQMIAHDIARCAFWNKAVMLDTVSGLVNHRTRLKHSTKYHTYKAHLNMILTEIYPD